MFDNVLGPGIQAQVPPNFLSEKIFEQVSSYVFPSRELLGSIVSVTTRGVQVMSCSYSLESSKYVRHRFSFAVGMVFAQDDDTGPYQPVLHKMTKTLCKLERDQGFLSSAKGKLLGPILERVLDDLVVRGECQVTIASTTLALKLFPKLLLPPPVSDYEVPVLIRDLRSLMTKDWDLTIQQLEPYIDGRNFIKRIAYLSGIELGLVRQCIAQLLYYRVVAMVDVFQYGNFYVCTSKVGLLLSDPSIEKDCIRAVTSVTARKPPSISRIVQLYASLHPSAPFGEFCNEFETERYGIDDLNLASFGIRFGIIRRVHCVPVFVSPPGSAGGSQGATRTVPQSGVPGEEVVVSPIQHLVDGKHTFDEICGETTMSVKELVVVLDNLERETVVVRM